jgi:hypothetical protein
VRARPADGASDVSVTANVEAVFSKEMDPLSINSSTFELREEGSSEALTATVRYDADDGRAVLGPSASLLPGTSYTATIKGGPEGAKDTSGKELVADKTWSFAVAPDQSAPHVRRVVPAEGATGIAPGANVAAAFSEAMAPSSINTNTFKLYEKGSTTPIMATVTYDPAAESAVLNPGANLKRGATYKAVVTSGAKDLAGNALDQNPTVMGSQQKAWSFTIRK